MEDTNKEDLLKIPPTKPPAPKPPSVSPTGVPGLILSEVKSSSIAAIGHLDGAMYIKFVRGALYRYEGVPVDVYKAAFKAESVGKHLQVEIMRKYSGIVVPEPTSE